MNKIKTMVAVDHIGYAVKDMRVAREIFGLIGYNFGEVKVDTDRNVNVSVGVMGGVKVELLSPINEHESPLDGVLAKNGAAPYHICYEVRNMEQVFSKLRNHGFIPIGVPAESKPLGGTVCFMFSPEIGLLELIEYQE